MDNPKQQVIDRLKQASNVLVTVSNNPSVDQLAACIGLALMFNKMGKHGTAVFSGQVPSTIEFLQPEKTIEKNTDSLRDFIIALDKSKADKLRYKVEDRVVKIFITPYRTTLGEKDLEFSQGDYNVDVVVGLGVHQQAELDQAITTHGRILHDATVISINNTSGGDLGNINWLDTTASSLSELVVQLGDELGQNLLDNQIATALLTGIVAATDRFSNDKTSPQTMSISAKLMQAGANQQLVSTKLQELPVPPVNIPVPSASQQLPPTPIPSDSVPLPPTPIPSDSVPLPPTPIPSDSVPLPPVDDGTLEVDHNQTANTLQAATSQAPISPPTEGQIDIDNEGQLHTFEPTAETLPANAADNIGRIDTMITAESNNNQLMSASGAPSQASSTAAMDNLFAASSMDTMSTSADNTSPPVEPAPQLSLPPIDTTPLLSPMPPAGFSNNPPLTTAPDETLEQLEEAVHSPHLNQTSPDSVSSAPPTSISTPELDAARNAVNAAVNSQPNPVIEPIQALNAQTAFENLQGNQPLTMPVPPASNNPLSANITTNPLPATNFTPDSTSNAQDLDMPQSPMNFPLPSPSAVPPDSNGINNLVGTASTAPPVPPPLTFMPPVMPQPDNNTDTMSDFPI